MDFFSHFDLIESCTIDLAALRKAFLLKSREVHPDHSLMDNESVAMESTSMNNLAYETLKDPLKRIQYILELNAIPTDAKSAPLGNDFLMEMMEMNELIEEAHISSDLKHQAKSILSEYESSLNADYKDTLETYNLGVSDKVKQLLLLREYFFKKNYLTRLKSLLEGVEEI